MLNHRADIDLNCIAEEELLNLRLNKIPISIRGTWLEDCIEQLYKELSQKGIFFKPECYLADEWLTPENETCIGIPFYLAHPRLIRLEKNFMQEAEGEGREWCMKLLRHEAGHTLYYAYALGQRRRWQSVFGSPKKEYRDSYKFRPFSRNFVRHLEGYYAQYHPEEDFVETFAVWLTPGFDWREKYRGWKVLQKLEYVDSLMSDIRHKLPKHTSSMKYWRLSTLRYTLKYYYSKKRKLMAEEFPDFHDPFLTKNFFIAGETYSGGSHTHQILSKYRKELVNSVAQISGEKKHTISELLRGLHKRSRQLNLMTKDDESKVLLNVSSYMTSLAKNYQYTGRYRGDN